MNTADRQRVPPAVGESSTGDPPRSPAPAIHRWTLGAWPWLLPVTALAATADGWPA